MHTKTSILKTKSTYRNIIKSRKIGTRNFLIDKKSYKNLMVYFTRYRPDKISNNVKSFI